MSGRTAGPIPYLSPVPTPDQHPVAIDRRDWHEHIPALASALAGIQQAADAWDAVSDSFQDTSSPSKAQSHKEGKAKRDAEAWRHVEIFIDHGPEVLAGVRAAARTDDYLAGPIRDDLAWLRGVDAVLEHVGKHQHNWDAVVAHMPPEARNTYESRATEIRNAGGWPLADELLTRRPALVRAAHHLASRAEPERPTRIDRARVALARSAPGLSGTPSAPTRAPQPPGAPTRGRSR